MALVVISYKLASGFSTELINRLLRPFAALGIIFAIAAAQRSCEKNASHFANIYGAKIYKWA
jgi:hypothetical protein